MFVYCVKIKTFGEKKIDQGQTLKICKRLNRLLEFSKLHMSTNLFHKYFQVDKKVHGIILCVSRLDILLGYKTMSILLLCFKIKASTVEFLHQRHWINHLPLAEITICKTGLKAQRIHINRDTPH